MNSESSGTAVRRTLLIVNSVILSAGGCGGPLISRLYFLRGGSRIWFSSWLETGGWPVILIPLLVSYTRRRGSRGSLIQMDWRVFLSAAVIGVLTGLDDYLYASGVARLPVSTSSLIIATQLAFTAGFAFLIVRQRFTACSINAVVLLTVGAVMLGMHTGGDRPEGETSKEYLVGFFMTLGAAGLYGFVLPMVELTYARAERGLRLTYTLVLEMQLVMCFFATLFCTVGMLANRDFQAISKEAKEYQLGEAGYYLVVTGCAILWQCFFLGTIGVIFYSSSLLSGIIIAVLIPATEVLGVIFYHEKFQAEKGISLFLSLWGFISYFYGEIKQSKKKSKQEDNQTNEVELPHQRDQIDA